MNQPRIARLVSETGDTVTVSGGEGAVRSFPVGVWMLTDGQRVVIVGEGGPLSTATVDGSAWSLRSMRDGPALSSSRGRLSRAALLTRERIRPGMSRFAMTAPTASLRMRICPTPDSPWDRSTPRDCP